MDKDMKTRKELAYREYLRHENALQRTPYHQELQFYSLIKDGDVRRMREEMKEPLMEKKGLGVLSENPLQNMKYHFVVTAAMAARYSIQGGMELGVSYSMSDFYIRKADVCKTVEELSELHAVMCMDYTRRMQDIKKQTIASRHILLCVEYIYENLHTRITVQTLAETVGLSPAYLSRLFKKEIGSSISAYIQGKKIETAENMLRYSEYTISEISVIMAFPSQSYFSKIFRKYTGMTPNAYRRQFYQDAKLPVL